MAIERGDTAANLCNVTISVSWETAEALAELLPALAKAISEQTSARQGYEHRRRTVDAEAAAKFRSRAKLWRLIGCRANTEIRRRLASDNSGLVTKAALINEIACRHDLSPNLVRGIVDAQAKRLNKRARRFRNWSIFSMWSEGKSTAEIGRIFNLKPATIANIVTKQRKAQLAAAQAHEAEPLKLRVVAGRDVGGTS